MPRSKQGRSSAICAVAGDRRYFHLNSAISFANLQAHGFRPHRRVEPLPPLADSLVILKKNYRFPADSGIGAAGRAVNAGKGEDAIAILKGDAFPDIVWHDVPKPDGLKKAMTDAVIEGYGTYLAAGTAAEALETF